MRTSTRTPTLRTALLTILNLLVIGLLAVQITAAAPDDPEPSLRPDAPILERPRMGPLVSPSILAPAEPVGPILPATSEDGGALLRTSMLTLDGVGASTDWFQTNGVSPAPEGRQAPGQRPTLTGQYGTDGVILVSVGL